MQTAVFRRKDVISRHLTASRPRISWSLDIAPRLGGSGDNRTSIVVAVDDFSKYVVLTPLLSIDSAAMASWFLQFIVAPYGKPQQVRVDNGNEWRGSFPELLTTLQI